MRSEIIRVGALRRHRVFCRALASLSAVMFLFVSSAPAFADPTSVLGGNAVLTGMARASLDSNGANAAVFSSSSASAVLDWTKFNIDAGQSMTFNGASTTFFNLVDGAAGMSEINGMINGSGNVWVINPAGIAFGAGSSVNVGGLFAAAAGNVENEAELRAGTATTPAFSSFAGAVDASKGSFTAEQVALMGKTVNVNGGDFSGAKNLSGAASTGAMTVDEVEGGKVSVNISDFAADDSEIAMGDLQIDGALSVKTTGSIVARESPPDTPSGKPRLLMADSIGPTTAPSEEHPQPYIQWKASEIDVDGELRANSYVSLYADGGDLNVNDRVIAGGNVSLRAERNVNVNADVTSRNGDVNISSRGALTVGAGVSAERGSVTAEANSGVVIDGTGVVGAGLNANIVAYDGDVEVNGGVIALQNANVYAGGMRSQEGKIRPIGSGSVTIGETGRIVAGSHADVISIGDAENGIEVGGVIQGFRGVDIVTNGGKGASVSESAEIRAVLLDESGRVVVDESGNLIAGDLEVVSHLGGVTIDGTVLGGCVSVGAKESVGVGGFAQAIGSMTLGSVEGDVSVGKDATVSTLAADSGILLYAASGGDKDNPVSGVAQIDGTVSSQGDVSVWAAASSEKVGNNVNTTYHEFGSGSVQIGETGTVEASGRIDMISGLGKDHGIEIDGSITAGEVYAMSLGGKGLSVGKGLTEDKTMAVSGSSLTQLGTTYGDLTVAKGATVKATGAGGDVVLSAGDIKDGRGSVIVAGIVRNDAAPVKNGSGAIVKRPTVSLQAATHSGSQGGVTVEEDALVMTTGEGSLIQVSTGMRGGYEPSDPDRTIEIVDGKERVRGTCGDVEINGAVGSTGNGSQVFIWGGFGDHTHGSVTIGSTGQVGNGGANGEVKIWSARGKGSTGCLRVESDAQIYSSGVNGHAYLFAAYGDDSRGVLTMNGHLYARGVGGRAEASAGHGDGARGKLFLGGTIDAYTRAYLAVAYGPNSKGRLEVSETGRLCSGGYLGPNDEIYYNGSEENYAYVVCGLGEYSESSALLSGGIVALGGHGCTHVEGARGLGAYCDLTIADSGEVVGRDLVDVRTWNGDVCLDGTIGAIVGESCRASLLALSDDGLHGNVTFGQNGGIISDNTASIFAQGDIRQPGSVVRSAHGYLEQVDLPPAVQAKIINVRSFGDVGDGKNGESLSVSGNVRAIVDGDASLAAANGEDFRGGGTGAPNVESLNEAQIKADTTMEPMVVRSGEAFPEETHADNRLRTAETVNDISTAFSDLGTGMFKTGGSLSIYTAGKLEPNGLFSAGGDLTLSAATFGNVGNMSSYFQAGGKLTVNNVGHPAYPQIAYFESVDGREPKINNQPNDVVIFVDGRLAGGNLNIINKFGATEAFPVSTPELKSEQGIFGNPVFLHGDLDVANPMAVGNVDYMLQEIPRLTLASDFPLEIDKSVNTAGLNPKDVYRFGQHAQVADEKPQADEEEKKDDKASAEESAEPKVAMR